MKSTNIWKLQDAKARLSEVVRKARAGAPQTVTIHGKDAVIISDAERFEVRPKLQSTSTMADFIEGSKKYRGLLEGVDLKRVRMNFTPRPIFFEENDK
ncbi:MAG: type II toxin-antitoxin system prevent-host-death family antitoxin [Xanthobacteraceae bacterium]